MVLSSNFSIVDSLLYFLSITLFSLFMPSFIQANDLHLETCKLHVKANTLRLGINFKLKMKDNEQE